MIQQHLVELRGLLIHLRREVRREEIDHAILLPLGVVSENCLPGRAQVTISGDEGNRRCWGRCRSGCRGSRRLPGADLRRQLAGQTLPVVEHRGGCGHHGGCGLR